MAFDVASPTLTSRVGDLLRVTIGAGTEPDSDSVDKWLEEAAIQFYKIAPEDVIFKFTDTLTPAPVFSTDGTYFVTDVDMLRLVSVEFGLTSSTLKQVKIVDERHGKFLLRTNVHTLGYFVAWLENGKLRVNYPTTEITGETFRYTYLTKPTNSDEFPEEFYHHLVDYAYARAKTVENDDPSLVVAWRKEIMGQ